MMSAKKRKATSTLGGQGHSFERIVDIAAVRGKRCKICSQVIQEAHTELVHCTNRGCRITKAHAPCVNTIDSSNKCKGNSRMAPALRAFIGGRAMRASTESEQHSPQSKRRDTSRGTTPCDDSVPPRPPKGMGDDVQTIFENAFVVFCGISEALDIHRVRAEELQTQFVRTQKEDTEAIQEKLELLDELEVQIRRQRQIYERMMKSNENITDEMDALMQCMRKCLECVSAEMMQPLSKPYKSLMTTSATSRPAFSVDSHHVLHRGASNEAGVERAERDMDASCEGDEDETAEASEEPQTNESAAMDHPAANDGRDTAPLETDTGGMKAMQVEQLLELGVCMSQVLTGLRDVLRACWRVDDSNAAHTSLADEKSFEATCMATRDLVRALSSESSAREVSFQLRNRLTGRIKECEDAIAGVSTAIEHSVRATQEERSSMMSASLTLMSNVSDELELSAHPAFGAVEEMDEGTQEEPARGKKPTTSELRDIHVDALLELITSGQVGDPVNLQTVFLRTYRYYMTTARLLERLIMQYCIAPSFAPPAANADSVMLTPAHLEKDKFVPIRMRVLVFLRFWISNCFEADFLDGRNRVILESFIRNTVACTGNPERGAQLLRLIVQKLEEHERGDKVGDENMVFHVMEYLTEQEWAEQLTLVEHSAYKRITWLELTQQRWTKKNKEKLAPNLCKNSQNFNTISSLVVTSIVSQESIGKRCEKVRRFLLIALHLFALNNFNGALEILAGLDNTPVARLRCTWNAVGTEWVVLRAKLMLLLANNHYYLRKELERTPLPCMPYVGMFLTDLIFLEDGNSTTSSDGRINMFKMNGIAATIDNILKYQEASYNIESIPGFARRIFQVPLMSYDEAYSRSLKIETRKHTKSVVPMRFNPVTGSTAAEQLQSALDVFDELRKHPFLDNPGAARRTV